MASRAPMNRTPEWQAMLRRSLIRIGTFAGSIGLYALALFLLLALLSYKVSDQALNTAARRFCWCRSSSYSRGAYGPTPT